MYVICLGIDWCLLVVERVIPTQDTYENYQAKNAGIRVEPNELNVINRYLLCGNSRHFDNAGNSCIKKWFFG